MIVASSALSALTWLLYREGGRAGEASRSHLGSAGAVALAALVLALS
jgi:hypothetical protein